jgi:hypothetical protein
MSRRSGFRQTDIARALKGATAAGMKPSGCRIDPATGAIEVTFGGDVSATANTFDAIIGSRR